MDRSRETYVKNNKTERGVGELFVTALWQRALSNPKNLIFFLRVGYRLLRAARLRSYNERLIDSPVPSVVAISPTMRCNYDCLGCYSRGRSSRDELTKEELDSLLNQAEELGVLAIVVTGGEPLLRTELIDLFHRHRRLLFVLITNGTLITERVAKRIRHSGNVVTLISIEGYESDTDERRSSGAYGTAINAFKHLREAHAFFGFAAMVTSLNADHLIADCFLDNMISIGCAVGYFVEYVPCEQNPKHTWIMSEDSRAEFRRRVLELRRSKPIVLIHFPNDEYGEDNICTAAGRKSLHINSQGDIEPCPFMPVACDNIRDGGLYSAIKSPFLEKIRENPVLLKRQHLACALFEHRSEIENLAQDIKLIMNKDTVKNNMKEYESKNVGVRFIEPVNKSFSKQKEIRLRDYDCTQNGYYFVTICTHQKKPNIALHKDTVEQILFSLPERFSGLNIDWYVLMPTHIHVIFAFEGMKRSLSEVVRVFKALVTNEVKQRFWQRNYYEHIIRNEKALHNIRKYIENNPLVERISFEEFYRNGSDKSDPYKK